jgi:DNA-binding NarL/FixJ family response regulator
VETIGKVRRAYWVQGKKIRAIARELKLARDTVRRRLTARARLSEADNLLFVVWFAKERDGHRQAL